jgi:ADP-ribose pyrophosphatase YjhB (NUDIX family)
MHPTDLTVAAVIERDDKFLLVEEYAMGRRVVTQPGGHIEADESPEQAVVREVFEESGVAVECRDMIGVYLWIHPQTRQQFLRIVYAADYLDHDPTVTLDDTILGSRWMTFADIQASRSTLRTPAVLRCVEDYRSGRRASDRLLSGMLPLQKNVHRILASADLV